MPAIPTGPAGVMPAMVPGATATPTFKDLAYAKVSATQKLDLYIPTGSRPFPVVVSIHGGDFMMGDKADPMGAAGVDQLLAAGYVIAVTNYRLSSEALAPAQIQDIKAAVRKSGWTFTQLGPRFGYGRKSIDRALYRPWPAVERLISAVVGEAPWVLWPSRYHRLSEANKTSILAGIERLRLRLAQEPSRIRPI